MKLNFLLTFIFAAVFLVNVFAHEYWFEAENFFPKRGEKTVVHLYVGDGIIKAPEERAFQLDKTRKFELFER